MFEQLRKYSLTCCPTTSCTAEGQPAVVRGSKSDRMLTRMMINTVWLEHFFLALNERDLQFCLAVSVSYCVHSLTLFLPHFSVCVPPS